MMLRGNNSYLAARAKRPLLVFSIVPRIAQSENIFLLEKLQVVTHTTAFNINEHGRLRRPTLNLGRL